MLVEDHSIVRLGVQTLLEKSGDYEIMGSFSSGEEGLKAIKLNKPDLVILDLNLQDLPGELIVRDLFLNKIESKVIVLSRQKYIPQITHLIKLGVKGYVVKDEAADEILSTLEKVWAGETVVSQSIKKLLDQMGYSIDGSSPSFKKGTLTEREKEIVIMLCKGLKSEVIASRLSVSPITVRVHTKNILKKLGLKSLSELSEVRDDLF